jgi:hypothetical protein
VDAKQNQKAKDARDAHDFFIIVIGGSGFGKDSCQYQGTTSQPVHQHQA